MRVRLSHKFASSVEGVEGRQLPGLRRMVEEHDMDDLPLPLRSAIKDVTAYLEAYLEGSAAAGASVVSDDEGDEGEGDDICVGRYMRVVGGVHKGSIVLVREVRPSGWIKVFVPNEGKETTIKATSLIGKGGGKQAPKPPRRAKGPDPTDPVTVVRDGKRWSIGETVRIRWERTASYGRRKKKLPAEGRKATIVGFTKEFAKVLVEGETDSRKKKYHNLSKVEPVYDGM